MSIINRIGLKLKIYSAAWTQKYMFFLSPIVPTRLFWCELLSFGDIICTDVCLPSSLMELDSTLHLVLKALKNTLVKPNSSGFFQK